MKFLSTLLLLGGYMLVYAAIAKSGRFVTEPWEGLFHDAYGDATPATPSVTPQPTAPNSPRTPRPPLRTNRGFRTP